MFQIVLQWCSPASTSNSPSKESSVPSDQGKSTGSRCSIHQVCGSPLTPAPNDSFSSTLVVDTKKTMLVSQVLTQYRYDAAWDDPILGTSLPTEDEDEQAHDGLPNLDTNLK